MTAPAAEPTAKKPRPKWLKILISAGVVLVGLIIIGAIVGPKKSDAPAASSTSSSASLSATSSVATTTESGSSSTLMTAAAAEGRWTEVTATATDPVNGQPAGNIDVSIEVGWSDELAEGISADLWIKYGDVVRIEYRCEATGDYLGRSTQDDAGSFQGTVNRNATCPTSSEAPTSTEAPAPASGPVVVSTLPNGALLSSMGNLRPNQAQQEALTAQLGIVEPAFSEPKYVDRYIGRAVSACDYIRDNPDATADMIRTRTIASFTGGTVPNLSEEQGDQLVAAITGTFCVAG